MPDAAPHPRFRAAVDPEAAPLLHPADVLDYFAEYKRQYEAVAEGRALGPVLTSTPKLGAAIGGCLPVGVTILHGPPGAGKTALANQFAAEAGCPALIVSFEMAFLELLHRQAARVTKTYVDRFRSRALTPAQWLHDMRRTVATMPDLRFVDATRGRVTMPAIRAHAEATRGNSEHLLIVVDSAHSWIRRTRGEATEYDAIGTLLDSLQSIAHELSAAVLVVAEQNRVSLGSDRQDAARGSGAFEYSGEIVIALSRDNVPADADGEIPICATLAKNRYGEQGPRFDLRFCGRRMAFREGDGTAIVSRKNGKG
jgi:replicative DNA helicase